MTPTTMWWMNNLATNQTMTTNNQPNSVAVPSHTRILHQCKGHKIGSITHLTWCQHYYSHKSFLSKLSSLSNLDPDISSRHHNEKARSTQSGMSKRQSLHERTSQTATGPTNPTVSARPTRTTSNDTTDNLQMKPLISTYTPTPISGSV